MLFLVLLHLQYQQEFSFQSGCNPLRLRMLPFSATNAFLISFPSFVFIGIFCKLGSLEANLPVFVEAKERCMYSICFITDVCSCKASVYVLFNFETCLHSKTKFGNLCPVKAKSSKILALVAKLPFFVFNFVIFNHCKLSHQVVWVTQC